jgi:hypothetical protein
MARAYQKVPFSSGSKGLDSLVTNLQNIPANRVVAASNSVGGLVNYDHVLNQALNVITRISNLSPNSPGGASIPSALAIGWDVYGWVQQNASSNSVVIPGNGRDYHG